MPPEEHANDEHHGEHDTETGDFKPLLKSTVRRIAVSALPFVHGNLNPNLA